MHKLKTILVVDDSSLNRRILRKILETEYEVVEAENGKSALDIIKKEDTDFSAVILDLVMPIMDGFELMNILCNDQKYKELPIIITTGNNGIEDEKKALELGAWDFVSKPYDVDIIKFRIKNAIDRSQLFAMKKLKFLAEYDVLTEIYNKEKFSEMTRKMLDLYHDEKFAFLRFDIDRFQLVNSFFGMDEGDRLLKYIGKGLQIKLSSQKHCTYGRIESDVFCICVTYDKIHMNELLNSLKDLLANFNADYDIVPSIGVYIVEDNSIPIDVLYKRSALAAKKCKNDYINFCSFYDEKMERDLKIEQEVTNGMNIALIEHQFVMYYQPKYDIFTNKPYGAEALVRWFHPIKGIMSPKDFIPIFEKNGFILKLDYYVWETVCKQLREWIDTGKNPFPISVNISRVNLYNPKLVENLIELTQRYDLPTSLLELELTESAYTDNPDVMIEVIKKLQDLGFTILMDDFGSGYSSLNILKDIDVDILKIDMFFFSKTEIKGRGENIIASVIRMAKWLKIPVIAEGVETREQIEFLRSVGCDYVQGYYYAKPMSALDYSHLAQSEKSFIDKPNTQSEEAFDTNTIWAKTSNVEKLFVNNEKAMMYVEYYNKNFELVRVNNAYYDLIGDRDIGEKKVFRLDFVDESCRDIVINNFEATVNSKGESECDYIRNTNNKRDLLINVKMKYISKVGDKNLILCEFYDATKKIRFQSER